MAAVNTKETLKELSIEISLVRMELIKQNLVIISFKKHKLGSALGDPFKAFKNLDGYQLYVSGFVENVTVCKNVGVENFVIVKFQVKPKQRKEDLINKVP